MLLLKYFQKLPPDTPNVASASSGLTSRETEQVSKELKKMQGKGKKRKKCMDTTTTRNCQTCCKKWKCQHTSIPVFKLLRLKMLTMRASKRVLIFQKGLS